MINITTDVWAAPAGSNYLASASIVLNDLFAIRGIHIRDGKYGRYITMPQKMVMNGDTKTFEDICYPWSASVKKDLTDMLLKAYDAMIAGQSYNPEPEKLPFPDKPIDPGELPFEVAVWTTEGNDGLLADIALGFERTYVATGIKLRQSRDKKDMYLTMPSYPDKNGVWRNYCSGLTPEYRNALKEGCIAAYKAEMEKINPTQSPKTI